MTPELFIGIKFLKATDLKIENEFTKLVNNADRAYYHLGFRVFF